MPLATRLADRQLNGHEFAVRCVFYINARIDGAYMFSGGKNMGSLKGAGFPEGVGRLYRLEEDEGHCFTADRGVAHGQAVQPGKEP